MHLLALWNPSYADNPLEAHVSVLLEQVRRWRDGQLPEDAVEVWWGLVKSPNRQAPLPHLDALHALAEAIAADETTERHLYLTDYRSLVVAELLELSFDPPPAGAPVPPYYTERGLRCDAWLRLGDIRTLVRDDLPAVIAALRPLRNTRYHDRPVSLYGGMVDLPLIVTRDDGQTWFTEGDIAPLDGQLWVEFDRSAGSAVARMSVELRENLLGETLWNLLHPTAQVFLATGEAEWRDRRDDPGHDPSGLLLQFAKAVELEAHRALLRVLVKVPPHLARANLNGRTVELATHGSLTLGELVHVLEHESDLCHALYALGGEAEWFATDWPPILKQIARYRNTAGHTGTVTKATARRLRDRLLGVGEEPLLGRLVRVGR